MLLKRLREAGIDLALLALPVPRPGLVCEELLHESLYVVVPRRHRLAAQTRVDLRQIADDPFLLMKEGHCFRENTLTACRRARLQLNVAFESRQFETILAMVAAGMGVSVVPEMVIAPHTGDGKEAAAAAEEAPREPRAAIAGGLPEAQCGRRPQSPQEGRLKRAYVAQPGGTITPRSAHPN